MLQQFIRANWTGQDEQSVEMGRRRETVTSTTNASTDAEGITGGVSTVTTDFFEKSHYEVRAGVGNGNGVARAHGTQFGAEGTRLLDSLDIMTITLHADGKTSKYHGFHETRSETSTQEFLLTGGQGGSLTGSTFGMGIFNVFHRDKMTSLTESTDVNGVLTRDETVTLEAGNSGSTSFSFSLSNDGLSMSFSGGNTFANSEESTTVNGVRTAYEAINSTHSSHSMSMGFDYSDDFVIFAFNANSSSGQGQKIIHMLGEDCLGPLEGLSICPSVEWTLDTRPSAWAKPVAPDDFGYGLGARIKTGDRIGLVPVVALSWGE